MDVNWVREYLLLRHPLAVQIPLAVLMLAVLCIWRGARESLRGRCALRWTIGIAVVAGGLMLAMFSVYVRSYQFLDHVEPNVVGIAEMFATGRPIYHPVDSAERYALLYGPNLFILYGALLKLTGSSVPVLKAVVLLGFAGALAAAWAAYRRTSRAALASAAVAYLVVAIASYADLPLWVRAEPVLMLLTATAFLAALTMGPISGAVAIGLAAGLAVNVKAHAPLYFVAAWLLFPHRWKIGSLLTGALAAAVIGAAPFLLFRREVSIELYLTWLREAGKHGLRLSFLARNLEILIYFALPPIALTIWAAMVNPRALREQLWKDRAFVIGLALSAGLTAVVASKPGAGPWHLMPLLIPFGYLIARVGDVLTQTDASPDGRPVSAFPMAALLGVMASFGLVAIAVSGSRLPVVFDKIRPGVDAAIVSELRQIVREHEGSHVMLGVGGDDEYRLSFFRPILIGLGEPYLLDYAALMDMKLSAIPMPAATRQAMTADRDAVWIFPTGSRPFSVTTVYSFGDPLFDASIRAEFEASFSQRQRTPHFDIWEPISTGGSTAIKTSSDRSVR